jgi:L-fuculose-phosphate aldolase
VAGIALDRAVLAEVITTLGSIPIAEYATPSTEELPAAVAKYVKAHDGLLLANHGALALAGDVMSAYYRHGDDRAFREDQPRGAHARGGKTCCRAAKSTGCRDFAACTGSRHRPPICTDDCGAVGRSIGLPDRSERPDSDERLVAQRLPVPVGGIDGEIRLTYRELTALIEDAVRALK